MTASQGRGGSGGSDGSGGRGGTARDDAGDDGGTPPDDGGTPPVDPVAVSRFVEAFAAQLVEGGMASMPARVFAALLASEDGVLTSAELSERLQVSPAAVSGAVRFLTQMTMVSREREPGSRRERYRVHSDQWYEMLTDREGLLRRWESTLREGITAMGAESGPGRRIAETLEFFIFLQAEFSGVMERWRKHREEKFGTE